MPKNTFSIKKVNDSLVISHEEYQIKAVIHLNEGARLASWEVAKKTIVGEPRGGYTKNFAGALMIPFVNRINKGEFHLDGKRFRLPQNGAHEHAIHGLIYDGHFTIEDQILQKDSVQLRFSCNYDGFLNGYPFPFTTTVAYQFTANSLGLTLSVNNSADRTIPITMGWHPYFYTTNRGTSHLNFNAKGLYKSDHTGITTEFIKREEDVSLNLSDQLDHAFLLRGNKASFQTDQQHIELLFPDGDNYLQVYTPEDPNFLAIEPMTGISDSFNNKVGLQTVAPGKSISQEWKIDLKPQLTH